jgi:hypothetical protein
MTKLVSVIFILVGIINILPAVGMLSSARLEMLYQIKVSNPELEILLRHRAVLFGLVGGLLIYAAISPTTQALAFIAGMISMLSFVLICWRVEHASAALTRIMWIDIFAVVLLSGVIIIKGWKFTQG